MSLSASQKSIIKASIPFLEKNGVELTSNFYSFMLDNHPEVRPFFNKAHQISKAQPKILAFSLNAYAKNIDDITPLKGFVRQIVEKHVGLQVKPQHYDIVGSCLLQTMKKMLGDAATDEFIEAWKVAYYDLANLLIQLEKERYAEELQQLKNSWPGFADAHVHKIVQETPLIKSVYFKLDDEKATISDFYPGQYIGLRLSTDGGETFQSREYSISNELEGPSSIKSSNSFRISVKRIEGGVVSNFIHDTLKVGDKLRITSPFGKLTEPWLKSTDEAERAKPVNVFVGGIGITPNVSITEHFLKMGNPVKLFLSNADINSRVFGQWVSRISEQYPKQLQVKEFITEKAADATDLQTSANHQIHYGRRLEQQDLDFITKENVNDFQYFMVGPVPYMQFLHEILGSKGINPNAINSEEFAPVHV